MTAGPVRQLEADIGILHVDRTLVTPEILPDHLERLLLNGSILDISKRRYSRNILTPDSGHDGPVIVKTDANSFGRQEYRLMSRFGLGRFRRRIVRYLPWQLVGCLPRRTYPVLQNASLVPGWVWRSKELVVERFRPERSGEEYVLRSWIFFGDKEYGVKLFGKEPVVKVEGILGGSPVPGLFLQSVDSIEIFLNGPDPLDNRGRRIS